MASRLQLPADDSVLLRVTHSNLKIFSADVRFSLEMTVESVKEKPWKRCGTAADSMLLELYDDAGSKVCDLGDAMMPFVTSGGWLEDTSLIDKYMISEEAYNKLNNNFRKFKEKIISQNPLTKENKLPENYMDDLRVNIKVGVIPERETFEDEEI